LEVNMAAETEPRVFVGIDWGGAVHEVCVLSPAGEIIAQRSTKHEGAGLEELGVWLASLAEPSAVAVAIETPRGPVVEGLLERGFSVYSINPKQMDRFRDRFTVAGAKDDRFDARVLADSLRSDRVCFRALRIDEPVVIELREWSRMVEELQQERGRLASRIREQLWRYFPQMLKVTDDLASDWFLDLWEMAPTPALVKKLRRNKVESLLKQKHIRRIDADGLLKILKEKPIVVAPGTTEAAQAHVMLLVARLRLVNAQHRDGERRLDQLCEQLSEGGEGQKGEQRDVEILRSLPGLGRIVLATLLAEAAEPLRNRDYHALRTLSGIAPVTRRSGKSHAVHMRYACCMRLRNALYYWANCAIQRDPLCRVKYRELRKRGHSHGRALRSLADRLLKIACAMLRAATVFDPQRRPARAA
jgi:transposase